MRSSHDRADSEYTSLGGYKVLTGSHDESDPYSSLPSVLGTTDFVLSRGYLEQHGLAEWDKLCVASAPFHELVRCAAVLSDSAARDGVRCMPHQPRYHWIREVDLHAKLLLDDGPECPHEAFEVLYASLDAAVGIGSSNLGLLDGSAMPSSGLQDAFLHICD